MSKIQQLKNVKQHSFCVWIEKNGAISYQGINKERKRNFFGYTVTILFMYVITSYVLVIGWSSVKFNNLYYF